MALNIKNAEVETIAEEAAEQRIQVLLARFRTEFPDGDFGRKITKREKEEILGYGPDGV